MIPLWSGIPFISPGDCKTLLICGIVWRLYRDGEKQKEPDGLVSTDVELHDGATIILGWGSKLLTREMMENGTLSDSSEA